MLKVKGTCQLLNDNDYIDCSIKFYLDASMIPKDQIAISGKVSGVSLKFLGSYYIDNLSFDSIKYVDNVSDDMTLITPLDQDIDDDQDDNVIDLCDAIKQMTSTDWSYDVQILIDTHWNCYCKYKQVCGCGCDPNHDGWT